MRIISILIIIPVLSFAKLKIKNRMIQPLVLKDYPLALFIDDYALGFDKTILISHFPKKNIKVNLSLESEVKMDSYEKMVLTILESHGMSMIDDGSFTRILQTKDIRYTATDFFTSNSFPKDNRQILVFHKLKNPLSRNITRNMRPFMSRYGRIINFNDGHSIVIADRGENINSILSIINGLDNKESFQKLSDSGYKKKRSTFNYMKKEQLIKQALEIKQELLKRQIEEMKGEQQ